MATTTQECRAAKAGAKAGRKRPDIFYLAEGSRAGTVVSDKSQKLRAFSSLWDGLGPPPAEKHFV